MSNKLLLSRFFLKEGTTAEIIKSLWPSEPDECLYVSLNVGAPELLVLKVYDGLNPLVLDSAQMSEQVAALANYLVSDVQRELLAYIEAPIISKKTKYDAVKLQLRHVEVKPEKMDAYRQWREQTIFNVIRENADLFAHFDAYHSLISTQPGVLFLSGFSCAEAVYQEVFNSVRYQGIVQQAGEEYIVGGGRGLYAQTYDLLK